MLGLPGPRADRRAVSLLRDTGACGVLLLARNIESPGQLRRLTSELTQRLGRRLLFSIDHEGGWVLRFSSGLTAFPGNLALGRAGSEELAYATGRQMALELAPLGVRLNLAPVVDVSTRTYNPGIGIRSFGQDPALARRLAAALVRGMEEHGVAACLKHFPGKGAAAVDAHIDLPVIRKYDRRHLDPFRVKAACLMTSHVLFPSLDRTRPATFSPRIVHGLIRRTLGFGGVIISDDLCMGAVTRRMPVAQAAVDALDAGHDLLLVAHEEALQREAVEAARAGFEAARVAASWRRLERLFAFKGRTPRPDAAYGARLARATAARAVLVREGALELPLVDEPTFLFPDFAQVKDRFTFEGGPRGPERLLAGRKVLRVPVLEGRLPELPAGPLVFFCYEARRFPGQNAMLRKLNKEAAARTAAVLIRSPWDAELADPRMTLIDTAGYRLCQLKEALNLI